MIEIDLGAWTVTGPGGAISLPRTAFRVAAYLARRPGIFRSRGELLDALGINPEVYDRIIDSHVSRVRRELASVGVVDAIVGKHGVGYAWRADCPVRLIGPEDPPMDIRLDDAQARLVLAAYRAGAEDCARSDLARTAGDAMGRALAAMRRQRAG